MANPSAATRGRRGSTSCPRDRRRGAGAASTTPARAAHHHPGGGRPRPRAGVVYFDSLEAPTATRRCWPRWTSTGSGSRAPSAARPACSARRSSSSAPTTSPGAPSGSRRSSATSATASRAASHEERVPASRPPGRQGCSSSTRRPGWTSHDVVAKLRGVLGTRKVGHAGTLDPDATGVLLVGVGSVTRLLRFLSAAGKAYEAEIVLGVETTTLDASGEVTATHDMAVVTAEQVRAAAADAGRRHRAGAAHGLGGQGRRAAAARAGPRRAGGGAGRPARARRAAST